MEADTVEGRLADLVEEGIVEIDGHKLSDSDRSIVVKALRAAIPPKRPERKYKTIIHVNQHIIRDNLKNGVKNPPLTIRQGRNIFRAQTVEGNGPFRVVHSPDKPLSCGARVWIETDAKLEHK